MLREPNLDIMAQPNVGGTFSEGLAFSPVTVARSCLPDYLGHAREAELTDQT